MANYIKLMARGCCCASHEHQSTDDVLIGLVAAKLNELTGDSQNPLTLLAAVDIVNNKLDEINQGDEISDIEYATDLDVIDLFKE